jgi:hypothetical protein
MLVAARFFARWRVADFHFAIGENDLFDGTNMRPKSWKNIRIG